MHKSTGGVFATLAALVLAVPGCTSNDSNEPPCTERPTAPACAPVSMAPTTSAEPMRDILVRDVSTEIIVDRTRELTGMNLGVRFVPTGEQVNCTLSGWQTVVGGAESQVPFYCDEGYIAIPQMVTATWAKTPAIGIWYEVASQAVRVDPDYKNDPLRQACAAAFVATRKLGYTYNADGRQLLAYVTKEHNATQAAFVNAGLTVAKDRKPITTCKTAGS